MWSVCAWGQQSNRRKIWLKRKTSTPTSRKFVLYSSFIFAAISPLLLLSLFFVDDGCCFMMHGGTLFKKLFSLFTIRLCIQVFAHWLNMSTTWIWDKNTALDIKRNDYNSGVSDEPKSTHRDIQVLFTSSKNLIQIEPSVHNAEMVYAFFGCKLLKVHCIDWFGSYQVIHLFL